MSESYDTLARLRQTAQRISERSNLPIVLPPICHALGVKVERRDTGKARALLLNARTRPRIVLNAQYATSNTLSSWERFLVAHELGHLVLHRYGIARPKTPSQYWETEDLCDAFGRTLLLPERIAVLPLLQQGAERILEYLQIAEKLRRIAHVDWATAVARIADWDNRVFFFRLLKDHVGRYVVRFTTLPKRREIGRKPDVAASFFDNLELGRAAGCNEMAKTAIPALQNAISVAVRVQHSDVRIGGILAKMNRGSGPEATERV